MKIDRLSFMIFSLVCCCSFAAQGAGQFAGHFQGDGLVFTCQGVGDDYTGVIKLGDQAFNFTGRGQDGQLRGTFESGPDKFDFKAAFDGDTLNLESSGTTYKLTRPTFAPNLRPINPLAANAARANLAATSADPVAAKPAAAVWKNIYRHESGASFRYPDRWQVREDANLGAVLLFPDNGHATQETIMVSGAEGQGASSAGDAIVQQGVESAVLRFYPLAKRTGMPEAVKSGSRNGVQSTWDVANPDNQPTRIRVYTTVLGKYVVSLSVIAAKEQVSVREPILRQIFNTFDITADSGAAEPTSESQPAASGAATAGLDSRLVGTWYKMEYKQVLSSSVVKYTYATLRADGGVQFQLSGESYHPGVAGRSSSSSSGHWRTKGSNLTISSDDGTDAYTFEIVYNNGTPALRLYPVNGGKMQEWDQYK